MIGFILENIGANAPQEPRPRRTGKSRVIWDGDNLGHYQDAQTKFQSGKLAQVPENAVHPVLLKQLYAFSLQKSC